MARVNAEETSLPDTIASPTQTLTPTPLQVEKPGQEGLAVKIANPLQEASEFNKTYPPDAPYALVAIRFPAEYTNNFIHNANRLQQFRKDPLTVIRSYVDEQLLKSAYYAVEFYNYCSARLPAESVILEPMKIGFSSKGKVVAIPIRETVPALMHVEIFSSINLERLRTANLGAIHKDTFAEFVNIIGRLEEATKCGARAVAGHPVQCDDHFGLSIADFYNSIGNNIQPRYVDRVEGSPVISNGPAQADKFYELRTAYKFPPKLIIEPEKLIDGQGNAACCPIWSKFQDIIEVTLRHQNFRELQPYLMADYVEDIDPDMAQLLRHGVNVEETSGTTRRKLELLSRYMDNERRQIFALEAQRTEEALYSGELGDSIRTIAKSELEYLKHRSASKKRQYAEGVLGIAAGATSLIASASMPTPALGNLLSTMTFASVGMVQNEGRVRQRLTDTYQQFEKQNTELQKTFMLKFGNEALEVSGSNLDELRAKFKEKYQQKFAASTTEGTES